MNLRSTKGWNKACTSKNSQQSFCEDEQESCLEYDDNVCRFRTLPNKFMNKLEDAMYSSRSKWKDEIEKKMFFS